MYPQTYKYTNDHEWIDLATGRMGVTDYAQKQLGDIVFLELPEVCLLYTSPSPRDS